MSHDSELELSCSDDDDFTLAGYALTDHEKPQLNVNLEPNCSYSIVLSYFELYNEKIYDLFEDPPTPSKYDR